MHFDFEGRNFDTPTVESAVSWREQVLVSIVGHVVVLLLVLYVPRLQFLEDMAERRAERIAEIAAVREAAQLAMAEARPEGTFVFRRAPSRARKRRNAASRRRALRP